MPTTLCFDFGNTRSKCAVFDNDDFTDMFVLENNDPSTIQELIYQNKPTHSILASVIDHNPAIEILLSSATKFHKLTYKSKLPFTITVGKPETVGADRLALAAAAVDLHPQKHNLVIGLGSCITFNFINKFHEFLGGS